MDPEVQQWLEQANAAFDGERLDEARATYQKILAKEPRNTYVRNQLGRIGLKSGRYNDAVKAFDAMLKVDPKDHVGWSNRGLALQRLNRLGPALLSYNRSLRYAPTYAPALQGKGYVLSRIKRRAEALKCYDQALAVSVAGEEGGQTQSILVDKANLLKDMRRYDEALACYERVLETESSNSDALNITALANKGDMQRHLKEFDQAAATYLLVLRRDPTYRASWRPADGFPTRDSLKRLEKEESRRNDSAQVNRIAGSGARIGGVLGAIIGVALGLSAYQTNVTPSRVTVNVIVSQALGAALVLAGVGAFVGYRLVAALNRRFGYLTRRTHIILSTALSAIAGYVLAGMAITYLSHPNLAKYAGPNWLIVTLIALGFGILTTAGSILLARWVSNQIERLKQDIDTLASEIQASVNRTVFGEVVNDAGRMERLNAVERSTIILFLYIWLPLIGRDQYLDIFERVKDGRLQTEVRQRIVQSGALGAVLGVGFIYLLAVLSYPYAWAKALDAQYGNEMLVAVLAVGAIGLVAGLLFERRDAATGSALRASGALIGGLGGAVISTTSGKTLTYLHTTFGRGLLGLGIGWVAGSVVGVVLGYVVGLFSPKQANIGKNPILVVFDRMFTGASLLGKALVAVVILGVITACALAFLIRVPQGQSATATVTVAANQGWQDTGFRIQAGDHVALQYESGTWTITSGVVAQSDANGQPVHPPSFLFCKCGEPMPGVSTQALIGKVGNGPAFLVGDGKDFAATGSGELFLRINDQDGHLGDNAGSVIMRVTITQPSPSPAATKSA